MSSAFRYGPKIELTDTLRAAIEELDQAGREQAEAIAQEGADLATRAGFAPVTTHVEAAPESSSETLLAIARRLDASLIVVGAAERDAIRALGIGSVSRGLLHHADRPVLIVPRDDSA